MDVPLSKSMKMTVGDEKVTNSVFYNLHNSIYILRQQKEWMGKSRKWPVLMTFSTIDLFMSSGIFIHRT